MSLEQRSIYTQQWFDSEEHFNQLYPKSIQALARRHWTPLNVARKAAMFLGLGKNVQILDIGSGAGKFALAAGYYTPKASYTGVEQRKYLVEQAEMAKEIIGLPNVSFIHANFTQVDFRNFNNFYFYNSFFENLAGRDTIDESIDYSAELYDYYNHYLFKKLEQTPEGTRLVTFHSLEDEVPPDFHTVGSEMEGLLKFWIKV
jgi:hypothetical protein